jgi:hypothetical protein
LALHSAVTDWVAILQISQSLSGSTLGDQHWCQQCSFASGCVPSVRQAGRQATSPCDLWHHLVCKNDQSLLSFTYFFLVFSSFWKLVALGHTSEHT